MDLSISTYLQKTKISFYRLIIITLEYQKKNYVSSGENISILHTHYFSWQATNDLNIYIILYTDAFYNPSRLQIRQVKLKTFSNTSAFSTPKANHLMWKIRIIYLPNAFFIISFFTLHTYTFNCIKNLLMIYLKLNNFIGMRIFYIYYINIFIFFL